MTFLRFIKHTGKSLAVIGGVAAAGYAGLVAYHRSRYGRPSKRGPNAPGDLLLDQFIGEPEVAECHRIHIDAPPAIVLAAAREVELLNSHLIRAIVKTRELALAGEPDAREHPSALVPQMLSIGWVMLAERPEREMVLGAVTQPWQANPVFRSIPPAEFAAFSEPGYVKIAWTLRADPAGAGATGFYTETRVTATDGETRARFRNYWSFVAPGVELIRVSMLRQLKREAERRAHISAA